MKIENLTQNLIFINKIYNIFKARIDQLEKTNPK